MATPQDIRNQREFNDSIAEQRNLLSEITAEIGRATTATTQAAAEYRKLDSIAKQLLDREDDISNKTSKELEKLKKRAELALRGLRNDSDVVRAKLRGLRLTEDSIKNALRQNRITQKEAGLLRARLSGFEIERGLVGTINDELAKRVQYENAIAQAGGATRAAISSASGTMKKLGLSSLSTYLNIDAAEEAMSKAADEMLRTEGSMNQAKIKAIGLGIVFKGITKGAFSFESVIVKVFKSFLDLNKAAVDLSRQVGRGNVSFNNLNGSLATTTELLKTAAEFTRQTGLASTSVFTNSQLANIAESTKLLGLSAEQGNNLAIFSKTTGTTINQFEKGLVKGINAANKFGKSAVAPGVALQDALSASQGVALALGNNPSLLGKAATAARALGLELAKVDSIAEGLLNFESSIQNELEAQLLTGKNINLAKAREFALNNDLAGLSRELVKNGASAAEFANMNRIQQNSLAQALGMSRDELAKTIVQQDIQGKLTEEQKARILGITEQELKQQSIQQSINDSITKMSEALAGPLAFMAQLASHSAVLYTTLGGIATLLSVNMAAGFMKNIKYLSRILSISKATAAVEASIAAIKALSNPMLAVAGLAAAATVGGVAGYYIGKAQQTGDLGINPNGGPVVMSPREGGLYQGTRNDALMMAPPGAMGGSNAELLAEIKALRAAVERGGNVYMDGNKVGEALVLSTYKSS